MPLFVPPNYRIISAGAMAGVATVDITIPSAPKSFQLILQNIRWSSDSDIKVLIRVSLDGSTFLSTSSYTSDGFYFGNASSGQFDGATNGMQCGNADLLATTTTGTISAHACIFPGSASYPCSLIAETGTVSGSTPYAQFLWDRCTTIGRILKLRILNDAGINFTNDSYYQLAAIL